MIAISNLTNGRFPTDILTDFKRGAISAIQAIFPNANINGCFFHLSSTVWKDVENVGLQVRCVEEQEFSLQLRMLNTLAFLPP